METKAVQNPDGSWRVTNVPLVSTGVQYALSSGRETFTEDDLKKMIEGMQDDPAIKPARIKLGHTSNYNEALVGDAEQAFGRIDEESVFIGENGQTLFGDYTGMPEWLAKVVAIAYPNRSIEAPKNVETVTGRHYPFVLTAVSLLGVRWPGCSVLEDLPTWYGESIPDGVEFDPDVSEQVAAGGLPMGVLADADTSLVRRQFYQHVTKDGGVQMPDGDPSYWLWIRAERMGNDGLYLIAEDENDGDLFRFDVNMDGDEVNFGDPVPVKVEYPEKVAAAERGAVAAAVAAGMAALDNRIVVHASRAETNGPAIATQEGGTSLDLKALAEKLGLPEDASEEQVSTEIERLQTNRDHDPDASQTDRAGQQGQPGGLVDDGASTTPPGGGEQPKKYPPVGSGPAGHDPDPEGTYAADGTVTLDRATFEQLKAGANLALSHEQDRRKTAIESEVKAAVETGRIPPARADHWRTALAADFEGFSKQLRELEPVIPMAVAAGGAGNAGDGTDSADGDGFPSHWFPEIPTIREQAVNGGRVMFAKEG